MNKLILSLSMLFCLVYEQSIAQKPGTVRWSLLANPSPGADTVHSIKVQPDGKIVAAGNSYQGLYMAIAVGRYDGQILDSSFGINGMVTTWLDSAHAVANAVEMQFDGKIVVAGGYKKGAAGDFILARYKPDGGADSSFGINGIVRTDVGSGSNDVATGLAIQSDGKIVAAGRCDTSLALCRYNIDGSLDSSFDADGKLTVAASGATCVKLQTNGKIVVCCKYVVICLMPDGSLDYNFGTNAIATLNSGSYGMAIQNDGKILVAGLEFILERLDPTGLHDYSFGNGGVVRTPKMAVSSAPTQTASSVCLQADGRILAAGWAGKLHTYCEFAVARYQANGAPDTSFGKLGIVVGSLPNFYNSASLSAAINSNNELVLAGNAGIFYGEWALAGYYLGTALAVHTVPAVEGQIIVLPNPIEDFARIQSTHITNGTWQLSFCDLTGRTLYSETVVVKNNALDKRISLIGLPAALYLVKLDNGISRITVKLVKSR